ncbi:MAG: LysM peptidoglycan-binding domain-containing protein [Bacteroidetes bacterium]|nr:MAG: LysM peptidoglycan-binding domain-containing protein [Bacteroidota bacterium]
MKKLTYITISFLISIISTAQNYPIQNINGVEYYVYTVEASEGLYRISKKFNVLQADIYKANPGITEAIKAGQTLYIPVNKGNGSKSMQKSSSQKKVIEHKVLAKQTLYSISKMYGVEQSDIVGMNPEIQGNTIKIGQTLKIPISNMTKGEEQERVINQINDTQLPPQSNTSNRNVKKKYVTYEVKNKKETLYSISKQFGVSINEIIEANPYAQDGIKKGDILQIPIDEKNIPKTSGNELYHLVQPKETIYGICKQYNISKEDLFRRNPRLQTEGLKYGDTIFIASAGKTLGNTTDDNTRTYKIAYLLPFSIGEKERNVNIERFIDFYRGSLIAMEDIKTSGVSLEVYTFDTQLGTSKTQEIVKSKLPKDIDLIIGPAYPEQITQVASFAKKNNIVQVVPFTSHISNSDRYAQQYQFNPVPNDLDKIVAANIFNKFKDNNIYMVYFSNEENEQSFYTLPEQLERLMKSKSVRYVRLNINDISKDKIASIANNNKHNLMVIRQCQTSDFQELIDMFDNNTRNITFVTEHNIFDYAQKDKSLKNKDFVSYSLFNTAPTNKYISSYNNYFPTRSKAQSTPNYDLLGYDITLYFCKALQPNKQLIFPQDVALQQSTFNFTKQNNAFLNTGCFIYRLKNNNVSIERL